MYCLILKTELFHWIACSIVYNKTLIVFQGRIFSLKAYVNLCNMKMEWNKLTRRQRKGLKLMYRQGCTCNIRFDPWTKPKKDKNTCVWKNQCEQEEVSTCICHYSWKFNLCKQWIFYDHEEVYSSYIQALFDTGLLLFCKII